MLVGIKPRTSEISLYIPYFPGITTKAHYQRFPFLYHIDLYCPFFRNRKKFVIQKNNISTNCHNHQRDSGSSWPVSSFPVLSIFRFHAAGMATQLYCFTACLRGENEKDPMRIKVEPTFQPKEIFKGFTI